MPTPPKDDMPTMPATSADDANVLAALGDEAAQAQVAQAQAQAQAQQPAYTVEQLAKAQGAAPPSPGTPPTPSDQAKADGGQQTPMKKAEDEDEDETDEEKAERLKKEASKSMDSDPDPDEEALIKAMDVVEEIARGAAIDDSPDRRAELSKAYADGELDDEGRSELMALLRSEMPEPDDDYPEEFEKGFTDAALEDPAIQAGITDEDGVDVSAYLERLSAFVGGALDQINNDLSKGMTDGFDRLNRFNMVMAKANRAMAGMVVKQQRLIKSLGARITVVEETPEPRRTVPSAQALNKSMGPPQDGGDQPLSGYSRDQVVEGFKSLMQKSADGKSPCGRDICADTAHFESHGQVHPSMAQDIKAVLTGKQ
jgi:hypothetical protein